MSTRDICEEGTNLTASGTEEEKWEYIYGTDAYGNLPQYKKDQHVGHCWHPCPYSLQADDNRVRIMLGLSDTDPLPDRNSHFDGNKIHYMKTESRGSKWGFECTYDNCSYYTTNGRRYFYA
jgi:hypothetical protein